LVEKVQKERKKARTRTEKATEKEGEFTFHSEGEAKPDGGDGGELTGVEFRRGKGNQENVSAGGSAKDGKRGKPSCA